MNRIPLVDPTQAEGKAKQLLDGVKAKVGMVPNLYRAAANSPATLEGLLGLSGALGGGSLDAKLREQLALAVGESNGCEYCVSAHTLIGKGAGLDDDAVEAARRGGAADERADAVLSFARKVMETRGFVDDADLEGLRSLGFSDGEVTEIVAHVALNTFTNYLNHVVDTEIDFPRVPALADR